jgi:F-box and WD-40 domain protein CDC4
MKSQCEQILRGHTSTVRCIQSAGYKTVVSGSRDTTLRVWDLEKGVSTKVLVGHSSSVRCLAIHGDIVVSGSYDYTAMVIFRLLDLTYGRFGAYLEASD